MKFKEIMYYNFMDFESKKIKIQNAVEYWRESGAVSLRVALDKENIAPEDLTNFEKDYLFKLLEN